MSARVGLLLRCCTWISLVLPAAVAAHGSADSGAASIAGADDQQVVRVNALGYLPHGVKVAILLSKDPSSIPHSFDLCDVLTGRCMWRSTNVSPAGRYGRGHTAYRLDFTAFSKSGGYYIRAGTCRSPNIRIANDVYTGTVDFMLQYIRQQRCGYNPFLHDSCHTRDGYVVGSASLRPDLVDVVGGWHDASDNLKYVVTSATAVTQLLVGYEHILETGRTRVHTQPACQPTAMPALLDEAWWGLEWLLKMFPRGDVVYHQVADDRDHAGFRLPTRDSVTYDQPAGRPVYICTGRPQGQFAFLNRSTGIASVAGKLAGAFALGSRMLRPYVPGMTAILERKAREAYQLGLRHPGVCQTVPGRTAYFYQEENWVDDMELAAMQLYRLNSDSGFMSRAIEFGRQEPVLPWMGSDSVGHYQWYPFVNLGHYYLARSAGPGIAKEFTAYLRQGAERLSAEANKHPFRIGVPLLWCSNNYVSAALIHLRLYQKLTGDTSYRGIEAAMFDWLLGCNPWGTSMVVGLPRGGVYPRDPHSSLSHLYGHRIDGGLVDGPVRASVFNGLQGIVAGSDDSHAQFQSDAAVYHDHWSDYATNEPTLDGTASLACYLALCESDGVSQDGRLQMLQGGITRMDSTERAVYLVFTGHGFADGGETIRTVLRKHGANASFFFTGDFYRNPEFAPLIRSLRQDGHYLGAHSDKHLLYASWERRDSLLVPKEQFVSDLRGNYEAMAAFGIPKEDAPYFMPPYEWYNQTISDWCREMGITLVNFTPGTYSNADWTVPDLRGQYVSSDTIYTRILRYESSTPAGLNGFLLLTHIGADPRRPDKFYLKLDALLSELTRRGYQFRGLTEVQQP